MFKLFNVYSYSGFNNCLQGLRTGSKSGGPVCSCQRSLIVAIIVDHCHSRETEHGYS